MAAMDAVEIVWLDSGIMNPEQSWTPIAQLVRDTKLATVCSVGYLAGEDDETYYLIQTYDPKDDQGFGLMGIAKKNVKGFRKLTGEKVVR